MKKIVLSMAGVLAATAFAPEASAIPAFARQTGLACSSCHYQHFPVLSTTGQEFKNTGYTQVSAKGKFKGDDLSIPDTLNAAILLKAMYVKTNGDSKTKGQTDVGQWRIPDELSLFFGGRIGDNGTVKVGFMNENNMVGSPMVAGLKVPVVVALDNVTVQVVPYVTDGLGQAYGYELSSTGITRGIRWAEHRKEVSAAQWTGLGAGAASGIAFVVGNDMGYINYSRWAPSFGYITDITGDTSGKGARMSSSWLRIAATPTIADWAMHIGVGIAGGTNHFDDSTATTVTGDTKGTVIDVQAQGAIAEMETSFYLQNAIAPKSGSKLNYFNQSAAGDVKATTLGADVSVIPHTLHLGAAYRQGTKANSDKDDAMTFTAVYDLFQNVALHANYSMYTGPAYDVSGVANSKLTMMLEAAW